MNRAMSFAVLLLIGYISPVHAQDNSAPLISQLQPSGSVATIPSPFTFSGVISDSGGSGIDRAFFVIRNLDTNEWVNVDGSVDTDRVFRDTELTLSDSNNGIWTVDTRFPAGNFRLYVTARDKASNTSWWQVRTTIESVTNTDEIKPSASLLQPTTSVITTQTFNGVANDAGGSGLRDVFYVIRDLATGQYVSPGGVVEAPRNIRNIALNFSNADNATWQLNTALPEGEFRFYIGVSDNNDNVNYWTIRETFNIIEDTEPPAASVFVPTDSDIDDPSDFYKRDGYELINVIRMDVATRTTPGVCLPEDQSGCTLADVLADTNGDDDFKVDIDVKLTTTDLPDTGPDANAGLRQRGSTSRTAPQKSFRVRLEDDLWRNEERIQLNKHPYDQSRMTNKLAFDLMQRLPHLPSLRTQFVNLWIDDGAGPVNQGLYTHVESRAKEYLINRGLDKDDNVYKANFFTFSGNDLAAIQVDADGQPVDETRFEERIEIDRGKNHTKLVEMVAAINDPNIAFDTVLDRYFNRNNVLMWITTNLLLGHRDVIDQNYFLYNPKDSETFYFLPWDYDGSLRINTPLSDGNSFNELAARLTFGFANEAENNFIRQFYLLPGSHDLIVKAANEIRRDYITDDAIRDLSSQYANVIRPFISSSPDLENIGGVRVLENLYVWEERWQSFPSVVEGNLQRLSASPNMPLPHFLKLPFSRNNNTVLWWDRATDITGGEVSYDIQIASQADFADGTIIYNSSGIPNALERVEVVLDRQTLPSGTWYYRVQANSGQFYQIAKNQLIENGQRYLGVRKFSVP